MSEFGRQMDGAHASRLAFAEQVGESEKLWCASLGSSEGIDDSGGRIRWGVVAPKSPNVAAFRENIRSHESWLQPFDGFGPSNFLAGTPSFSFEDYRDWIKERFPPRKFTQLDEKMGMPVKYALGAFIQALTERPALEGLLRELGVKAHVYIATGLGDLPTVHDQTLQYYHGQRNWDRFWSDLHATKRSEPTSTTRPLFGLASWRRRRIRRPSMCPAGPRPRTRGGRFGQSARRCSPSTSKRSSKSNAWT